MRHTLSRQVSGHSWRSARRIAHKLAHTGATVFSEMSPRVIVKRNNCPCPHGRDLAIANSGPRSLKLCSTTFGILPLDEGFAMWWLNMDRAVAEIIPLSVCATLSRTPD
jgi:hypothetical protein